MLVGCYVDAYSTGLWCHYNHQDASCNNSRNGFVVKFSNFRLLQVSNIYTDIAISTLQSEYVALSHFVRYLLPF